jgi:hypothetical protein
MEAYQSLRQASTVLRRADVGLRHFVAAPTSRVKISSSVGGGKTFGGRAPEGSCDIASAVLGWRRTMSVVAHGHKSMAPGNRLLQTARMIWGPGGVPRAGSVFGFRRAYQHGSNSFHESSARLMLLWVVVHVVCVFDRISSHPTACHRIVPGRSPPQLTALHPLHCIYPFSRRAGATAGGMLRTAVVYFLTATGLVVWAVQLGELGMFYFFPDRWACFQRHANAPCRLEFAPDERKTERQRDRETEREGGREGGRTGWGGGREGGRERTRERDMHNSPQKYIGTCRVQILMADGAESGLERAVGKGVN